MDDDFAPEAARTRRRGFGDGFGPAARMVDDLPWVDGLGRGGSWERPVGVEWRQHARGIDALYRA